MDSETKQKEIEYIQRPQRTSTPKTFASSRHRAIALKKALISIFFGIVAALSWHFIHAAGEVDYTWSLADPHMWYHLLLEGAIGLYVAGLCFVGWTILSRLKTR